MDEYILATEDLDIVLNNDNDEHPGKLYDEDLEVTPSPVFCDLSAAERTLDFEKYLHKHIDNWTTDLTDLPPISHIKITNYFITDIDADGKSKGALEY